MKIAMTATVAAIATLAGGCMTEDRGYGPYYGPSQGYAYPQGYQARSHYAPPTYGYRAPYGQPYGGSGTGPSITFTIPQ